MITALYKSADYIRTPPLTDYVTPSLYVLDPSEPLYSINCFVPKISRHNRTKDLQGDHSPKPPVNVSNLQFLLTIVYS